MDSSISEFLIDNKISGEFYESYPLDWDSVWGYHDYELYPPSPSPRKLGCDETSKCSDKTNKRKSPHSPSTRERGRERKQPADCHQNVQSNYSVELSEPLTQMSPASSYAFVQSLLTATDRRSLSHFSLDQLAAMHTQALVQLISVAAESSCCASATADKDKHAKALADREKQLFCSTKALNDAEARIRDLEGKIGQAGSSA